MSSAESHNVDSHSPLAVTGAGFVSPLGFDLRTCCAAARAGLMRPEPVDYFLASSPDEFAPVPVAVHQASLLTHGFEGPLRLVRLLRAALKDLFDSYLPLAIAARGTTGFYLALPDGLRLALGASLVPDESERAAWQEKAAASGAQAWSMDDAERLLRQSLEGAGWRGEHTLCGFTTSGHTGFIEAVRSAAKDLRSRRIDRAVVCAADTLVEANTLQWLASQGRLKMPSLACGLQPGEAAAAILIEQQGMAQRSQSALATLLATELRSEPAPLFSGHVSTGRGLGDVLLPLVGKARSASDDCVWIVTDQNGEHYRAMDWGRALVNIAARDTDLTGSAVWHPASSFGETGAASGAVALCVVTQAFARAYAPASRAIVVSCSEGGERAGLLVGPGPQRLN